MPSWDDEYESEEMLSDIVDMDYCPDTWEDPDFNGLALGCTEVCRVHKLVPRKCVVFGGSDTGRRFYMCSVANQVENCGFVSWVDGMWPQTMKNAILRLWAMYEESNSGRIDDKIQTGKMLEELTLEKNKADKDYASLMADVKKYIVDLEKKVHQENYANIKSGVADELHSLKKEVSVLRAELVMRKNLQMTEAEVMKGKQKAWDEEKEAMRQEKKKLEYNLYDLLKVTDGNKQKLKSIKAICDE
ncbi:unnamed protein product [Alopecurus aequalis]